MESVRSRDGTTIAFERVGHGPPLVLVGGALSTGAAAATVAAMLASDLTVFTYDRRGRGKSGDTAPYTVDKEVDDLSALIDEAGGTASVFGHSSGAVLALEAAVRLPGIAKLALHEPPFLVDDTRAPLPSAYVSDLEQLVASGRDGDAIEYFMKVGVGVPEQVIEQMRADPSWASMEVLAHTLPYDGRVMGDTMYGAPLPPERWRAVTVPTLVMEGGASPAWQRNSARSLAEVLPNAERKTLEGQDHGAAPEVLVPVLKEFFLGSLSHPNSE